MCLAKRGAQEALRNEHLCLAGANAVLNIIDEGASSVTVIYVIHASYSTCTRNRAPAPEPGALL